MTESESVDFQDECTAEQAQQAKMTEENREMLSACGWLESDPFPEQQDGGSQT